MTHKWSKYVKSKQTHEPCVALDLALLIGSVKNESLELERCVEG